jgi:hypothetical protein
MDKLNLKFEKVSDINMDFPYLCVYERSDSGSPFMDISINCHKMLGLRFYSRPEDIIIPFECMGHIIEKGLEFYNNELRPENSM